MLTAKQEVFCHKVLEGLSQSDAYRAVYDTSRMLAATIHNSASKLVAAPPVVARLSELRERKAVAVVKSIAYTVDDAMREAQEDRMLAHSVGQAGAAVAATTLRAKLTGLLVERKEVRTGLLDDADSESLRAMHERLRDVIIVTKEEAGEDIEDAEVLAVTHVNRPMLRESTP